MLQALRNLSAAETGWHNITISQVLRPLASGALFTGGVDASREVWKLVSADTAEATHSVLKGEHIHVAAGTKPESHDPART